MKQYLLDNIRTKQKKDNGVVTILRTKKKHTIQNVAVSQKNNNKTTAVIDFIAIYRQIC